MKQRQKEFWTWNGEEMCSLNGVATLASQANGGVRPSKATLRKWLANGLMYRTFISRSYTFSVETVIKFLNSLNKPQEQYSYRQEVRK